MTSQMFGLTKEAQAQVAHIFMCISIWIPDNTNLPRAFFKLNPHTLLETFTTPDNTINGYFLPRRAESLTAARYARAETSTGKGYIHE